MAQAKDVIDHSFLTLNNYLRENPQAIDAIKDLLRGHWDIEIKKLGEKIEPNLWYEHLHDVDQENPRTYVGLFAMRKDAKETRKQIGEYNDLGRALSKAILKHDLEGANVILPKISKVAPNIEDVGFSQIWRLNNKVNWLEERMASGESDLTVYLERPGQTLCDKMLLATGFYDYDKEDFRPTENDVNESSSYKEFTDLMAKSGLNAEFLRVCEPRHYTSGRICGSEYDPGVVRVRLTEAKPAAQPG